MSEPRNLALEAVIREHPDDLEAYRVLGDWLEQRGHPRGRLIAVQAALAGAEAGGVAAAGATASPTASAEHPPEEAGASARRGELEREQAELIAALGHAADPAVQVTWRLGFWDQISAAADVDLARLLGSPSARLVRQLHLRSTRDRDDISAAWLAAGTQVLDRDGLASLAHLLRRDRDRAAWLDALPAIGALGLGELDLLIYGHAVTGADGAAVASIRCLKGLTLISPQGARSSVSRAGIRALAPLAPHLEQLAFVECSQVDDEACEMIAAFSRLEKLELDFAPAVTGRGLAALARLPRLEELRLPRNHELGDGEIDDLARFPALKRLDITGTRFTPAGLVRLAQAMPGLAELSVDGQVGRASGWWLDDRACELLAEGRPPIVSLRVLGPQVTLDGLARLAALPLRTLIVRGEPYIDDEAADVLARFSGLERLDLRDTPMSGAAIVRLASALPRLRELIVEHTRLPRDAALAVQVLPPPTPY